MIPHSCRRRRARDFRSISLGALAVAAVGAANATAGAQLRPLEPVSWRVFDGGAWIAADLKVAAYRHQRASLAGTEGDLWEVPAVSVAWRSGRVAILATGTGQRFFKEKERFALPYFTVWPATNGRRHDSGDYTIGTAIRLTSPNARADALLRFGTRLPTTDNETGLDRDVIDFFATIAGRTTRGPFSLGVEAGLGINSTRDSVFEQDDLLLYAARVEYQRGLITPSIVVVGQAHGPAHHEIRGVEDLSELRLGLRFGGAREWIRIDGVKGLETFSPSYGGSMTIGMAR